MRSHWQVDILFKPYREAGQGKAETNFKEVVDYVTLGSVISVKKFIGSVKGPHFNKLAHCSNSFLLGFYTVCHRLTKNQTQNE